MGRLSSGVLTSWEGHRVTAEPATTISVSRHPPRVYRDSLLIFSLGVAIFLVMPTPEFIRFQSRFAVFAQEMLRHGPSFFPTLYREAYPDYPATSTFLIYLVSLPFGRVTPFTAILPTAVVSALILVVTYRIGAIHSRRWGLAAGLLALFTVEFLSMSRSISLDQYTSLAVALSFYLAYSSDCFGKRKRLWLLPLVWGLGFAFRGPIGLVLPTAVSCIYYLWERRFKRVLLTGALAGGMLICCLGLLLLVAKAQGGAPLMRSVLDVQMAGRLHDRGPGFAYYWYGSLACYAVSYPLAIIVVVARFRDIVRRKSKEDQLLGALAFWAVIVLVGMSIPGVKKIRYVLPVVPALSLIASYIMIDVSPRTLLLQAKRVLLGICAALPIVSAVGIGGLLVFACFRQLEWRMCCLGTLGLLIPLALVARRLDRRWSSVPNRDLFLLTVGVSTFVILNVGIAEPVSYSLERTRPFVRQVEALRKKAPGTIVFFQIGPDAEDVKFIANSSEHVDPQFVSSLDTLWATPGTFYVIAREEVYRSLSAHEGRPMRVLVHGRIGHRDFVVFTLEESQNGDSKVVLHPEAPVRR